MFALFALVWPLCIAGGLAIGFGLRSRDFARGRGERLLSPTLLLLLAVALRIVGQLGSLPVGLYNAASLGFYLAGTGVLAAELFVWRKARARAGDVLLDLGYTGTNVVQFVTGGVVALSMLLVLNGALQGTTDAPVALAAGLFYLALVGTFVADAARRLQLAEAGVLSHAGLVTWDQIGGFDVGTPAVARLTLMRRNGRFAAAVHSWRIPSIWRERAGEVCLERLAIAEQRAVSRTSPAL